MAGSLEKKAQRIIRIPLYSPEFPAIYLARFGLQLGELTYHPIIQSPSETRSQAKT